MKPAARPEMQSPAELGQPWNHQHFRDAHATLHADGTYDLWLPVNPHPLERARVVTTDTPAGRRTRAHTPVASVQFYADTRTRWNSLPHSERHHYPADTDLSLTLEFWRHLERPRSQRGDLSNLVKAIEDALNGLLWHDDRQIVHLTAAIRASGRTIPGAIHLTTRPTEGTTP